MKKKIKDTLFKILAFLNVAEGFSHLIMASISFWGIATNGLWDIRIMASPIEGLIFGGFSIITGYLLGTHVHHNHFPTEHHEQDDCNHK